MGKKVLLIDLDPQCNLTIYGLDSDRLHEIWEAEDKFIEDFNARKNKFTESEFKEFNNNPRTIHYILKPAEDGTGDLELLPSPIKIFNNLHLIPGRLSLHMYENKIAERWGALFQGDPLSIRTVTQIRSIASKYSDKFSYDFIIVDTSPSLGALNKVIISTVDGFLFPCFPDMFSLYGIRNIGNSLLKWKQDFDTIYQLLSPEKRSMFPEEFVRFLGFTIYNAKKYESKNPNPWKLTAAAYNYAQKIPKSIKDDIPQEVRKHLTEEMLQEPIGDRAVMHTHNTLPSMAQKYRHPMWQVPSLDDLEPPEKSSIRGNRADYEKTKNNYQAFAEDLLQRIERLD